MNKKERKNKKTKNSFVNSKSNNKFLTSKSGITLIALILTIIILLILAMVSISYIMRENIIKHAETAVDQYQIEAEKEAIELAYGEYAMDKATEKSDVTLKVDGTDNVKQDSKTGSWTVIFPNGNVYTVDKNGNITGPGKGPGPVPPKDEEEELLERYLLGEKKTGRSLQEICDLSQEEFLPDKEMEEDISEQVEFLKESDGYSFATTDDNDESIRYLYIIYNKKIYRIKVIVDYDAETYETVDPPVCIYEPKGREGEKIKYSYDGKKENEKEWTIINDNEDGTVDIVCPDALKKENDTGLKFVGANENATEAINQYNDAINIINNYCNELITNREFTTDSKKYKVTGVRSVGAKTDTSGTFSMGTYEEIKLGDEYYLDDYIRLLYFKIEGTNATEGYWIASRYAELGENSFTLDVTHYYSKLNRFHNDSGEVGLINGPSSYGRGRSLTYYVRPVVTINISDYE